MLGKVAMRAAMRGAVFMIASGLLASCGGGGGGTSSPPPPPPPSTYTVGGTISGLSGSGLVLTNNGGDDLVVPAGATSFTFSTKIADGGAYAVAVKTQPGGPVQVCTPTNASGHIASINIASVAVTCVNTTYTVGGSVSGLTGTGLVLQLNGGDDLTLNADGTFQFTTPVNNNTAYAVTVLTQPSGQASQCRLLDGGNGYVAGSDVTAIVVGCGPNGIRVLAGQLGGSGNVDAVGTAARLNEPGGVGIDPSGNLFVADFSNDTIRRIDPAGVVTTLAGLAGVAGSSDGLGSAARFSSPGDAAADSLGNVYVADAANSTIRKVTPGGQVTTFAGTAGSQGGLDGTGSAARFRDPCGVAVDSADNVYVADNSDQTIRKITPAGVVTTMAGSHGASGHADGTGSAATFNFPCSVTVDASGTAYVADTENHTLRKITAGGVVTTLAGSAGVAGTADGTGAAARFDGPSGVAVDNISGTVYVADSVSNTIRAVTPAGVVTTIAGTAGTAGSADGTGAAAAFSYPVGLRVAANGDVLIADAFNSTLRRMTATGVVTTVAGTATHRGSADGTGSAASFDLPVGVIADGAGNLYVSDMQNQTIRAITAAGVVTTLAGSPGVSGTTDGSGSAARFTIPAGLALDGGGTLYVVDANSALVRKITGGAVTTLAGSPGTPGAVNGTGSAAKFWFNGTSSIVVDSGGNAYVTDTSNNAIRKITAAGVVTTFAGTMGTSGSANGTGAAARFNAPAGITIDASDNLYVADSGNFVIRKITPAGVVTTVAGTAGASGQVDATGAAARFGNMIGLASDSAGNLYAADGLLVRKIDTAGVVTTVVGVRGRRGVRIGQLPGSLSFPTGIAVVPSGTGTRLAVCDGAENAVLIVDLP